MGFFNKITMGNHHLAQQIFHLFILKILSSLMYELEYYALRVWCYSPINNKDAMSLKAIIETISPLECKV